MLSVYEVMRRIRKCFKSSNPRVVARALYLTDVLMESCGPHARREVGSDKFLKLVCKLCKVGAVKLDLNKKRQHAVCRCCFYKYN